MHQEELNEKSFFEMLGLADIKKRPDILSKIKLDVTPQMMMEPRFHSRPEDLGRLKEIAGYFFYIEAGSDPAALMLLKVGRSDVTNTVGKIDEVPQELIRDAIENPAAPPVCGMYSITDKIEIWLRGELGL